MQTFLPYPSFEKSAECLDYRRLGKQRLEAMTIYKILMGLGKGGAWAMHPATLMWKGYENALAMYYNCIVRQWIKRGYNNTMPFLDVAETVNPPWLGVDAFHRSHQSNLVRKDPAYYQKHFGPISGDLPYFWPTKCGYGDIK